MFFAAAQPSDGEAYAMSLPDVLLQELGAPGRHMARDLVVEGAECVGAQCSKGHRLPKRLRVGSGLLCRREGTNRVVFEVATRWGTCRQQIPVGDGRPRC